MTNLYRSAQTRRGMLIGLGAAGIGLIPGSVLAADRPTISTGRITVCSNAGVLVSDMSGRIATVADFSVATSCRLSRSTVEGPYFICTDTMNRRDIAAGLRGTPMTLALRIIDRGCKPVPGAIVDVWQCDARGNYSGHAVNPDNPPRIGRGRPRGPDVPSRFLRGVLAADGDGIVEFDAIYPGYYYGRAIHTHFKVHVGTSAWLTSQALYPEVWNEKILANPIYRDGRSSDRVPNSNDYFGRAGGLFSISLRRDRLLATLNVAVQG